jgi:hypothetical protein
VAAESVRVAGAAGAAMTTGAEDAVAVAGAGAGAVAAAGAGEGAGAGAAGFAAAWSVTRRITIGRGVGCRDATAVTGRSASGVTTTGAGSASARTMAGCAAAPGRTKEGVSPPPGPAKNRGNATVPATAPASNTVTATPRVIAIMFPTPDADGITRTRYRQVGTRA